MIQAQKIKPIESFFVWINRGMFKQHFYAHHLRGQETLKEVDSALPLIFYANHSSWWDGLLAFHLSHDIFRLDTILMMEEQQLKRYLFFRWIGAFSVDRENRQELAASIEYSVSELRKRRALWIYPQGILLPNDIRPLAFYNGIAYIARNLGTVQLIPVVHRYEFLGEQRPEIFTSIGQLQKVEAGKSFDPKALTRELEKNMTLDLNVLREDVVAQCWHTFKTTIQGDSSTNVKYDRFRGGS